ncbi:AAA domain-containing protein [Xenorhabdus taiwanensis]|uniref:DNA2/NAM7 helicase helicase domain-containing protein n=1 Tax=Xenorhabdus taiwanensis TaxID=3085177 RepID=A0ABM8JRN3_9GAMM|nr:hypothetical protein TCT1_02200 [Xenorhabdus sp. TCT-1]
MDERKYLVLTRSKQSEFKNTTKRVVEVSPSGSKTLVTFLDGKTLPYNKTNVRFFESPEALDIENSIVRLRSGSNKKWDEAFNFDNQYVVFFTNGYIEEFPFSDVEIIPNIAKQKETKHLIDYYRYLAKFLKESSPYVHYYYEKKLNQIRDDSVLSNFVKSAQPKSKASSSIIFPFGVNPSQREAVTNALTSQLSIIQGPPGTGKTQTILNIIANLVCQNKTVAVVAGNNAATSNVYEKLEKEGFGFIAASLGKADLQEKFFVKRHNIPEISHWELTERALLHTRQEIASTDDLISELLELQNEQAKIRELISKIDI